MLRCAWALCFALVALASAAGEVQAAPRGRIAVRAFEGPGGKRVRRAVVGVMRRSGRYEIVAEARAGWVVEGRVERSGRKVELVLGLRRGGSSEVAAERTFIARTAGELGRVVRKRVLGELREMEREGEEREREREAERGREEEREREEEEEQEREREAERAGAEEKAKREREREAERTRAEEEARGGARAKPTQGRESGRVTEAEREEIERPVAFELGADVAVLVRAFRYDGPSQNLAEHSIHPTPSIDGRLRWYPAASFTAGAAAHLGLELRARLMWPIEATQGPLVYTTEARELEAGLRVRLPLGRSELGITGGVGGQDVSVSDSQFGGDPEVPSVAYRYVRLGAGARIALGPALELELAGAYLHLLDFGELTDARWFPHAAGAGVEAELGASYALTQALRVEVGFGWVRYFLKFHSRPDDVGVAVLERVADGASDQQLSGGLGLSLRL